MSWRSKLSGKPVVNLGGRWGGRRSLDETEFEFDPHELAERSLFIGSGHSDPIWKAANDLANFWKGRHGARASVALDAKERIRFSKLDRLADDVNVERFRVTLRYVIDNQTMYYGPHVVDAGDQIDAESKVREQARANWRRTAGGTAPQFEAYRTERIQT